MPETKASPDPRVTREDIALPSPSDSHVAEPEWCLVRVAGQWQKIRFDDYDGIYGIPGLYEALCCDVLGCRSPSKAGEILIRCIEGAGAAPDDLRVVDLGAGSGIIGEELARLGVRYLVGVDTTRAAAAAARRDRPAVYDDYFVLDMTDLSDRDRRRFESLRLNCLTCVAALDRGDIPPAAFAAAYNLIAQGGWAVFNIESSLLETRVRSGFAGLIRRMIDTDSISIRTGQQYRHRLATNGQPLLYTAFVGVKNRDIPADWEP